MVYCIGKPGSVFDLLAIIRHARSQNHVSTVFTNKRGKKNVSPPQTAPDQGKLEVVETLTLVVPRKQLIFPRHRPATRQSATRVFYTLNTTNLKTYQTLIHATFIL